MNGARTKPSRTKRLTRRRCAKKNESTMRKACLNMGMPNLVAKNDLYYVGQLGMTGSLLEQETNRAGLHEGHWHCMVFVTEWAVATLFHGSEDAMTAAKTHHFFKQNVAKKTMSAKKPGERTKP